MPPHKRFVILWNQSNTFGLSQDANVIEYALRQKNPTAEIVRVDPLQPPTKADVVIHLEVPHPVWFKWAPTQIWMVNPEWCVSEWNNYREQFSQIWVKEADRVEEFGPKAVHIPWAVRGPLRPIGRDALGLRQALWILGGSQNKHVAARVLLPIWPADFPITVTTTLEPADLPSEGLPPSVTIKRGFLDAEELEALNTSAATHVCISAAEGFGYTAAQAEARSAAMILNTLPVYNEYYGGKSYAGFLNTPMTRSIKHYGYVADFSAVTTDDIKAVLQTIPAGEAQVEESERRFMRFVSLVGTLCNKKPTVAMPEVFPPRLSDTDCPPISVLTVTYNRRNFMDLCFLNLLVTDYPKSKIQWVIVEDSDVPDKMALDKITGFENRGPGIEITYVPLKNKHTVGYKRNKAVEKAKHAICVNMDDDDVYPETSFRRRVSWLQAYDETKVVGCTMIAMYDLLQGISAVNTPPWALHQSQRVSEASFCFYKSYALENPFPDAGMAEGEGFVSPICGSGKFLEIPPQQIVVALNHGSNTSTRVIAGRAQTGCFWGWDQQFIVWLHGLVGVQVEAATT